MNIYKFLEQIGNTIVSIEINATKYSWQVPHKLLSMLRNFESCLTKYELEQHKEKIIYLKDCLHKAKIKIRDNEVAGDARVAVLKNMLEDLKINT